VKFFRGRAAKLEAMNRILTDSARERAERVEQLERKLELLEPEVLEARKRLKELEQAATERAARIQELERELQELRTDYAKKDVPRLEAEHEFYRRRMTELEMHNGQFTEAATKYALQARKLATDLYSRHPELIPEDFRAV
jgi:chromosome segregation ATPase